MFDNTGPRKYRSLCWFWSMIDSYSDRSNFSLQIRDLPVYANALKLELELRPGGAFTVDVSSQ
jgi:hypothetical protein